MEKGRRKKKDGEGRRKRKDPLPKYRAESTRSTSRYSPKTGKGGEEREESGEGTGERERKEKGEEKWGGKGVEKRGEERERR